MTMPFNWQEALQNNTPELMKHVGVLREELSTDGALSARTKTLMMMLGDAILGHGDGVAAIANNARAMGVTEEEIVETIGIAFLMGGMPGLVTGSNAFRR